MQSSYEELTVRNKLFIPERTQRRLSELRLSLLGCGLSSQIATLAARTGVQRFVIADGDRIERSNFNRQAFDADGIRANKAVQTAGSILKINPQASAQVMPRNVTLGTVGHLVESSDVLVCTVDVGPVYYRILEEVQAKGKVGIFPMNVGFGSLMFVGSRESGDFEDVFGLPLPGDDMEFYLRLYLLLEKDLPPYLADIGRAASGDLQLLKPSPPQLGIACYLTAAMVMTIIIKLVEGEAVPQLPHPIRLDLREVLDSGRTGRRSR